MAANVTCPPGLILGQGSFCYPPCPLPVLEPDDFYANYLLTIILGWLSFFSLTFMILTYTIFPENRKWPRRLMLYIASAQLLVVLPFIGNTFLEMSDYLCDSDGYSPKRGGWCAAQGDLLIIGGNLSSFWLLVTAFHLFYTAVYSRSRTEWLEKWYNLVGWLPGAIIGIVVISFGYAGASVGLPFCFLRLDLPYASTWIFFHGPNLFCLLLVTFFVIITFVLLPKQQADQRRLSNHHIRLLAYLFMFWIFGIFVVACVIALETFQHDNVQRIVTWYNCVYSQQPNCPLPLIRSQALLYLNSIAVSMQGIWIFLLFGATCTNFRLWRRLFRRLYSRPAINELPEDTNRSRGPVLHKFYSSDDIQINSDPNPSDSGTFTATESDRDLAREEVPIISLAAFQRGSSEKGGITMYTRTNYGTGAASSGMAFTPS
jgi:hypothetical protein